MDSRGVASLGNYPVPATRRRSQLRIVDRPCVMMMVVRPHVRRSIPSITRASVSTARAVVGSR